MPIPESQLGRWSHHGAQDTAKNTHERIRRVLAAHQWPPGMTYDFYLQGSYRNDTNIRGDSDVDVVLEMQSTFIYDISALNVFDQQVVLSTIYPPTYDWGDFRQETIEALVAGFDAAAIEPRNKSIKVLAGSGRLAADVVVCLTHRSYVDRFNYREGITLYSVREGTWVVNYPKLHYANGAGKSRRTYDRFKRTVRMFKNARNRLLSDGQISTDLAPSYFVECLVYNAPDWAFKTGFQDTFCDIVKWMIQNDLGGLMCQNGQMPLFGPAPEQWSLANAKAFGNALVTLWNNWG